MAIKNEQETAAPKTFWRSLTQDATANTIVIVAVSLVPLMAMVGGGVDASRYYMADTRLQAACDAGALAARRAMDADTFDDSHKQIANNFFDQNFEDGLFGMEDRSRVYTATEDGKVQGSASGTLPSSIMGAFGYDEFDLSVNCEADINVSNTDIMFVLDVTGSMNCAPDNPNGGSCNNVEATNAKIKSLRASALTFYDTVDAATSNSAQVRYGILPYSSSINVGAHLSSAWLADTHTYQSREPTVIQEIDWVDDENGAISSTKTGDNDGYPYLGANETRVPGLTYDECVDYAFGYPHWDIPYEFDTSDLTLTSQTSSGTTGEATYEGEITWKVLWNFVSGNYTGGSCNITYDEYSYTADGTVTVGQVQEITETFAYRFDEIEYDLSSLYSTGSLIAPTGTNGANEAHTWNGCIEEADTSNTGTFSPLPASANDLDIDLVPNSASEYWKPILASLVFYRFDTETGDWSRDEEITTTDWSQNPSTTCPKAARKLAKFNDRTELEDWLSASNGFVGRGSTYHDIGMIWGGRFISPDGIFSSENATAPNGDAISRHIIFMTDGILSTSNTVYTPYGIEWWDRRVTDDGSAATGNTRHEARFQAACKAARDKNISVWVVAFGTTLTQNLIDCATTGRAYSASDADSLDDAFKEIAEKIAALRLTA
ncbi:Tad domain-containing protein [Erythrobacter sp. F6033]|uniref:Tad domain-containing protein n=1 Tax=Erythrobacter sp. F6033 TaxID=2926401 RepID=UPI001FF61C41|nr:Tad domain-containing protein [Erythrobacter sp. F6033]MCK0128331.1 pilus assembly protein TadG-related protein [Erythrobacter sp. F6033]